MACREAFSCPVEGGGRAIRVDLVVGPVFHLFMGESIFTPKIGVKDSTRPFGRGHSTWLFIRDALCIAIKPISGVLAIYAS